MVSSWFNRDSIWLQTKISCVEISRNRFISPFEAEVISEIFACMIIAMTVRGLRPEVITRICCIASLNLSFSVSIGDVIPLRAGFITILLISSLNVPNAFPNLLGYLNISDVRLAIPDGCQARPIF